MACYFFTNFLEKQKMKKKLNQLPPKLLICGGDQFKIFYEVKRYLRKNGENMIVVTIVILIIIVLLVIGNSKVEPQNTELKQEDLTEQLGNAMMKKDMIDSVFGNKELDDVEKTLIGMKIADDIEKNNLEK